MCKRKTKFRGGKKVSWRDSVFSLETQTLKYGLIKVLRNMKHQLLFISPKDENPEETVFN